LRRLSGRTGRRVGGALRLEVLEDRSVPSILTVTNLTDHNPGSLRAQITAAAPGDTILFQTGLSGTIFLTSGELQLSKTLTIAGPGANLISVSGNNAARVFHVFGGVTDTVSGLTVTSGRQADGGAMRVDVSGTLSLTACTVSNSSSTTSGGGIDSLGNLVVTSCTLTGNSCSSYGGGLYNDHGTLAVTDCTLSGNTANLGGGIATLSGTPTVTSSTVTGNLGRNTGGGLYSDTSTTALQNTIVAGNTTTGGFPADISGSVSGASSYDLIGTGGAGGLINGINHNQVGVSSPGLGILGNYGGPNRTVPLLRLSPALNAGDPALLGSADQRGLGRTGGVNIGAFQASAGRLTISAPGSVSAGQSFNVTVSAFDTFNQSAVGYNGFVSLSSTDPRASLPFPHTFTLFDGGAFTFTGAVLATPGSQTITASDGRVSGSASVLVNGTTAVAFRINAPSVVRAGQPFSFTVAAVDGSGNIDTNYTGSFRLGINPDAPDLGVSTFQPSDHGVVGFANIGLYVAGPKTITATGTLFGQASLTVTPAAANRLQINAPLSVRAGQPFDFSVAAIDPFGNTDTNYTGSFRLGINPDAPDLGVSTFQPSDHGVVSFANIGLYLAGLKTITATGTVSGQANLTVTPASAVALQIGAPTLVTAGQPFSFSVAAIDPYGNIDTNYTGSFRLGISPDAPDLGVSTFQPSDHGVVSFAGIGLYLAGPKIITATGTVSGQANLTVNPAPASVLQINAPLVVAAGQLFSFSVVALDPFGNVDTNYLGSFRLGINPDAPDLGVSTFQPSDHGVVSFAGIGLYVAGPKTITATGIVSGQASLTVTPGAAVALRINAPAVVTAGVPFDFTVAAVDQYGNVDPTYTGSFRLGISPDAPDLGVSTFTPDSQGVVGFAGIGLYVAGPKTITATGTLSAQASLTVTPAAAALLAFTPPDNPQVGVPFPLTVTAYDAFGNVATGYTGNVVIFRTDGGDPIYYTFNTSDAGQHTFIVTVPNPGPISFFVIDRDNPDLRGDQLDLVL
jgi:S-adenosylmethionine hydrolase